MKSRTSYQVDGLRVAQSRQALTGAGGKAMTQQELADLLDVHRVTLTKIESRGTNVSLDLLERLSKQLGRSREYLLGEPEVIDDLEVAKARIAVALVKVGDGLGELADLVETLTNVAHTVAAAAKELTR